MNPFAPHATTIEQLVHVLDADAKRGLTDGEALARILKYGRNELPAEKKPSVVLLFLKQLQSGLVYVLFGAAALSFATGHTSDGTAILLVVALNATVGFLQERRAERAIETLRGMVVQEVTVIRDGQAHRVPSADVVPGDVLAVVEGDRVPADARLIDARDLYANESMLTGESTPVSKAPGMVEESTALADRKNMLLMGTTVTSGVARAIVVETGARTAFGKIAGSLHAIKRVRTPFEISVDKLGRKFGAVTIVLSVAVFALGALRGFPLVDTFFFAVAMAVSVIPEGLPAVVVVVLAIGVQAMAKKNAIVRHLPSVETLGAADVICTDKTGTLTENKMTVREAVTVAHRVEVTGEGWDPRGEFSISGRSFVPAELPELELLARASGLSSKAEIQMRDERYSVVGDPTEGALTVLAAKAGYSKDELEKGYVPVDEIPFTSGRKYHAVLVERVDLRGAKSKLLFASGAYTVLRERSANVQDGNATSPLTSEVVAHFDDANETMGGKALRVLAVAWKQLPDDADALSENDMQGLTFIGLVGMIDPPRRGVAVAIERCRAAGVRVMMLTGDQRATAVAIAREIGLLRNGDEETVITEREAEFMDEEAFEKAVRRAAIFARVTPEMKLRIVTALQKDGHTVAMTGDGVNDAPALKKSSIGIAMGLSGTDVAREVADMVLTDDNFVSIVNAIEEGRVVFRNFKQTTAYLFMTNMGEVATIMGSIFIGLPLPLLPAQILWLNLVTDGFCDVALATERARGDVLSEPPRKKNAPIITRNTLILSVLTSIFMCIGTLLLFSRALESHGLEYARSMAFVTLALFQLWNVFNMRSPSESMFSIGFLSNRFVLGAVGISLALQLAVLYQPTMQRVFSTRPLHLADWGVAIAVSTSIFVAIELYKVFVRSGRIPRAWR